MLITANQEVLNSESEGKIINDNIGYTSYRYIVALVI